jgi:hypothetical protein
MRGRRPQQAVQEIPFRLWSPGRFHAFVSIAVATAVGVVPGAAYAAPEVAILQATSVSIGAPEDTAEGDKVRFPVTIDQAVVGDPITVLVSTTGAGDATPDDDFTPLVDEPVVFSASDDDLTQYVEVSTTADQEVETEETVGLTIADPGGLAATGGDALGKIVDAVISVTPVGEVVETDGLRTQSFDIDLNVAFQQSTTFKYTIASDSDIVGGADATPTGFDADTRTTRVGVAVVGDDLYEAPATRAIKVTVSDFVGGQVRGLDQANSFPLAEDEPLPEIESVTASGPVTEGDDQSATVTVKLTGKLKDRGILMVDDVYDGTAEPAGDEPGRNDFSVVGSMDIPGGSDTGTHEVTINDDDVFERAETVTMSFNPIEQSPNIGGVKKAVSFTLNDDESLPTMSLDDFRGAEGDTVPLKIPVPGGIQGSFPWTATVEGAVKDGSDPAEEDDFDTTSMRLSGTLQGGQSEIDLGSLGLVLGRADEFDETVKVEVDVTAIGKVTVYGTIHDSEDHKEPLLIPQHETTVLQGETAGVPVRLYFDPAEGNTATKTEKTITVDYQTADNSADAGDDYTATNGTLTIAPPDVKADILIPTSGDGDSAGDRRFTVNYNDAENTVLFQNSVVTITDQPRTVSIGAAAPVTEGGTLTFPVRLSAQSSAPVTVRIAVKAGDPAPGDATPEADYQLPEEFELTFEPYQQEASVEVRTLEDDQAENLAERVTLEVVDRGGLTEGAEESNYGVIFDNAVAVTPIGLPGEPDDGERVQSFELRLPRAYETDVELGYRTADGTAEAGKDYAAVTDGKVVFPAGETSKTIEVTFLGDTIYESDEFFKIVVTPPDDAGPGSREFQLPIIENDPVPQINPGGVVELTEGDPGPLVFTLSGLTQVPISWTAKVEGVTDGDSAAAGAEDIASGSFGDEVFSGTIMPGEESVTIPGLAFVVDRVDEYDETLKVTIDAGVAGAGSAMVKATDSATERPPGLVVPSAVTVTEGDDVSIPITLDFDADPENTAESTERTLPVVYEIEPGTAGYNDYTGSGGTLDIEPGGPPAEITIPTVTNDSFEAVEDFTVRYTRLGNVDPGEVITGSTTVTITQTAPTVDVGDAVAVPEGNMLKFPVKLAGASDDPVTVWVSTTGGTAVADDDYTAVTDKEVTFDPGQTEKFVAIATEADGAEEDTPETVVLEVTDPGVTTVGTPTGTGKIVDGIITVRPVGDIVEGDSGVRDQVFEVKLNVEVDAEVRLDYAILADTAFSGEDYDVVEPGQLVFEPNQTSQRIVVPIRGDADDEGAGESFKIRLSDLAGIQAAGLGEHSFTIVDDDGLPSVLSVTGGPPVEGNTTAPATYTVTLSNPAPEDVVLDVTGDDDTAVKADTGVGGADYSVPPTVTVLQGERTANFDVTVNGDTIFEDDEKASIVVTPQDDATVTGGPKSATLSLVNDDDPPQITVDATARLETVAEGLPILATVTGKSQKPIPWTVTVAGDTGDATDGAEDDDFTRVGLIESGRLEPGDTRIDMGHITPMVGTADEFDETVRVALAPEGLPTVEGTVTIKDAENHLPPAATVPGAVSVTEPGTATVPVSLDFAGVSGNEATSTEKTVTVDYALTPGSAAADTDYTDSPVRLSFPPSTTTQDITVPIKLDDVAEPAGENFRVGLTGAANATVGSASVTTVTINDAVVVPAHTFTVTPEVTATEGQAGAAEITVTLDAPATDDVDFIVSATDETARRGVAVPGGDDYSTPSSTLRIAKDQQTAKITVPIRGDAVFEEDETAKITVEVAPGETAAAGAAQVSKLLIHDDDPVPTLTLNTASGAEGGTVDVIATPNGVAEDPISYLLKLGGATGPAIDPAEPADYVDSGTETILPAAATAPVTLRRIQLASDAIDEAAETIRVVLENLTAPEQQPVVGTYTVTDDPADLPPNVAVSSATVTESAGGVSVPVNLYYAAGNGATSTELPIQVFTQALPSEADDSDFGQPSPNPLIVPPGSSGGLVRVPIVDDTQYEPTETFLLKAASGAGPAAPTVITVTDDDPAPVFTVTSNVLVSEKAGSATVNIELASPASDTVNLVVGARDGTATDAVAGIGGDDYDLPAGTVQIPKGARAATVTVPIKADNTYEGDEKAQITVALAPGEKDASGAPKEATLSITDEDAKPTIKLNPVTVVEGASAVITAVVTGQAQNEFDLGDPTVAGDAGAGDPAEQADYDLDLKTTLPPRTANGSTVSLGTVQLLADTIDESDEGFTLTIAGSTIDFRVSDDPADVMPSVAISDVTSGESEDAVALTVSLDFSGDTTATERTVTVPWQAVDGSAKVGRDYEAASGTVTIDPSEGSAELSVPLIDDTQDEDDQLFLVRLGAASPNGITVAKADGKVTLEDDDQPKAPTLPDPPDPTGAGKVFISGQAPAGEKVELLGAPGPSGGTFRVLATAQSNSDGAYSFSPTFKQGYRIQVRSGKLVSPVRTIQVKQEPDIKVTSPSRRTARITVTGDPARAGQAVTVQQQDGGGWDTVATGRLDEDGEFVTTEGSLRSGRNYAYRASIAATPSAGILAGRSPSRTIRIK